MPHRWPSKRKVNAPAMVQNPNISARSELIRIPAHANSSAVTEAWKRAAPGSERPMNWCHASAARMQTSITSNPTTVSLSTWSSRLMANVWKFEGPENATETLM